MMRPAVLLLAALAGLLVALPLSSSLTVHVVPHTHDDVGWLKTVDQYYYGLKNDIQHAAVQYILKSVTAALIRNPTRRFMYVEQAFFQRFWREATEYDKNITRQLVAEGRLEFVNGGWCMHDEAAAHYIDMVDQTTLGHKFIVDQFGRSAVPTIGWQIDPFGHSATQAALLSAEVGFNGLFFGRIDYQDHDKRIAQKDLEFVWRASASLGSDAQVFSGAFQSGNYGPPDQMCFDVFDCNDEVVQANPAVPDYNLPDRVAKFIKDAKEQAAGTRGDIDSMNIMWNMGSDFQHEASEEWMTNLDKLIDGVNAEGSIKAMYSTPSIYLKAKNAEPVQWTVKTDDFFPYADGRNSYWTGYFTSRPALKRYIRVSSAFLQVARHMELFSGGNGSVTEQLWEAQSVAQHHDAVSGTAKQAVTYDYAQRISNGAAKADALIESTLASLLTTSGDAPAFAYCPLYNVSECSVVTDNAASTLVIALYNPNARAWPNATISVPSASANATIYDGAGQVVPSTTLPVFQNSANSKGAAKFRVWFQANVPGIGVQTYFLKQSATVEAEAEAEPEVVAAPEPRVEQLAKSVSSMTRHRRGLKAVEAEAAMANSIQNEAVRVNLDGNGMITSVDDLVTGTSHAFTQDWAYYDSWQAGGDQNSGAYIFRPAHEGTNQLSGGQKLVAVVNTAVVSEAWVQISDWIFTIIRLRAGVAGIEFEWTVGPIPVDDKQGKEVIIRFNSSIASNATWYTDSNGREFQQRIRNYRPTWKWDPTQPTAGNYYPVNSVAWLADANSALVVNNDRSQGCASINDGSLEFMVHRRMTQDDGRGVGEPLSEPGLDGKGLIVTGTLVVHLVPVAYAATAARVTGSILYSPLHQSYAPLSGSVSDYLSGHKAEVSFLKTALPPNVDLISAHVYGDGVLLRLAHLFGAGESTQWSKPVDIDLAVLFTQSITDAQEVTLSAALPISDKKPYNWNTTSDAAVHQRRGALKGTKFTISPAEVRTFIVQVSSE